jgi:hypothetical protein
VMTLVHLVQRLKSQRSAKPTVEVWAERKDPA